MEQKQEIGYQLHLGFSSDKEPIHHLNRSEAVSRTMYRKVLQASVAGEQERALTGYLMGEVCSHDNIRRAYKQVKQNKGVAGVDQMPVWEFAEWYAKEGENLLVQLLEGRYQPQAVRPVEILKQGGGKRKLGIPTVTDRIIQQAISQVLSPIYEQKFSEHSYGFRPGRNAQKALTKASEYVGEGREIVVDIDLKTFFDVVNHDRLMHRLSETIIDKTLLRLIRKYLQSGIMIDGTLSQRTEGTPQGSPLSPLLSNIVLDELDTELERRGHKFVRYADDCNIFVCSQEAGRRVMQSVSSFIEGKLKLKVNKQKSKVCQSNQTKFLGYTVQSDGMLTIAEGSIEKLKEKVRKITRRNKGRSFSQVIDELTPVLRGWLNYFRYANCYNVLRGLDAWIRRKLRCYRLKQCKKTITMQRFLYSLGIKKWQSWILALSGKGVWRKSNAPQAHEAMNKSWFEEQGLFNLTLNYSMLNNLKKPPCARACTVV